MQIGVITVDGKTIGVVSLNDGEYTDPFIPDLDGYEPQGRAAERPLGAPESGHGAPHAPSGAHHHGEPSGPQPGHSAPTTKPHHDSIRYGHHGHHAEPESPPPSGKSYESERRGPPVSHGSRETDAAIVEASRAHHLDPNTMRSIASIESGMNPQSNAHRSTQYKGLFQIGREEWKRFGGEGNIYSAKDNAMATGRMFEANRNQFRQHFHRDPSDAELYMMHQQGLGFYTRGAMTNISGNPYPGMHGPQSHESFEAGWGREIARRKAALAPAVTATAKPAFDPETQAP